MKWGRGACGPRWAAGACPPGISVLTSEVEQAHHASPRKSRGNSATGHQGGQGLVGLGWE